jgi:fumarylacetoacetase
VQPTGTPIHRPNGQIKSPAAGKPAFSPTQRLDYELELGVWMSASPTPGRVLRIGRAAEQIAGYCLLNDWSARDIQAWEYQPLGPFLAKNFATTVSAYVVTPEALEPFGHECTRPATDPKPLPYLYDEIDEATGGLNVDLEVALSSETMRANGMAEVTVCRSSTTNLYWTIAQLIAHHSSGGCELQAGDLLGSGTISTPGDQGLGSLLELSATGPIKLPNGETRTFLLDGDEVVMRGRASRPGYASVGFGECRARVLGPRTEG